MTGITQVELVAREAAPAAANDRKSRAAVAAKLYLRAAIHMKARAGARVQPWRRSRAAVEKEAVEQGPQEA